MMNKSKRGGTVLIALGLLLFAAALLLIAYNLFEERRAGDEAHNVLKQLQQQIQSPEASSAPDRNSGAEAQPPEPDPDGAAPSAPSAPLESPDYILNPNKEMPEAEIEGNGYIGILEIPALALSLPVMSKWSYPKLKIAPCRYSGSAYTGNLVIAAHNYRTHFGLLESLEPGAQVKFTDVEGNVFSYEIAETEILEPTAIEELLSDEWNLTLFTCTYGGQARVAVRCRAIGLK